MLVVASLHPQHAWVARRPRSTAPRRDCPGPAALLPNLIVVVAGLVVQCDNPTIVSVESTAPGHDLNPDLIVCVHQRSHPHL
jgi:hypothetical protein